jgi:hypothetical protein
MLIFLVIGMRKLYTGFSREGPLLLLMPTTGFEAILRELHTYYESSVDRRSSYTHLCLSWLHTDYLRASPSPLVAYYGK